MASTSRLQNIVTTVSEESVLYGKMNGFQPIALDSVDRGVEQIRLLFLEVISSCKHYDTKDGIVKDVFIEDKELRQLVEAL